MKTSKYAVIKKQQGGNSFAPVIAEKGEYYQDMEGGINQVTPDAPSHEDGYVAIGDQEYAKPKGKGGVMLPDALRVLSASQEQINSGNRQATDKDKYIRIKPDEATQIAASVGLKVDVSSSISPSKLFEKLKDSRDAYARKLDKKTNLKGEPDSIALNTLQANIQQVAALPSDEELFDLAFQIQEGKKEIAPIDYENETAQFGYSINGYKTDSPDRHNQYNLIPSNHITMQGVDRPLMLIGNGGETIHAQPNSGDYVLPNSTEVLEIPYAQTGLYNLPVKNGKYWSESTGWNLTEEDIKRLYGNTGKPVLQPGYRWLPKPQDFQLVQNPNTFHVPIPPVNEIGDPLTGGEIPLPVKKEVEGLVGFSPIIGGRIPDHKSPTKRGSITSRYVSKNRKSPFGLGEATSYLPISAPAVTANGIPIVNPIDYPESRASSGGPSNLVPGSSNYSQAIPLYDATGNVVDYVPVDEAPIPESITTGTETVTPSERKSKINEVLKQLGKDDLHKLRWYDTAGDLALLADSYNIAPNYLEQINPQPVQLEQLNPNGILQQLNDQSYASNRLMDQSTGVGVANAVAMNANTQSNVLKALGDFENQNTGIRNQERTLNAQIAQQRDLQNIQLRQQFNQQNLQAQEAGRQQRYEAINSLLGKKAQAEQQRRTYNAFISSPMSEYSTILPDGRVIVKPDTNIQFGDEAPIANTNSGEHIKKTVITRPNGKQEVRDTYNMDEEKRWFDHFKNLGLITGHAKRYGGSKYSKTK